MRYQRHIVVLLIVAAFGLGTAVAFLARDLWTRSLPPPGAAGPTKTRQLEIHEALKVALDALRKSGRDLTREYEVTITKNNTGWRCFFLFLPKTPGGHAMVDVDVEGGVRIIGGM